MIRALFHLSEPADKLTPLTITQALIDNEVRLKTEDLREIRDHLTAYLNRKDREMLFGCGAKKED